MRKKEREPFRHGLKDREVPPVKGAVTDLQDVVQRPAAVFGPAHPAEPSYMANPSVFDGLE